MKLSVAPWLLLIVGGCSEPSAVSTVGGNATELAGASNASAPSVAAASDRSSDENSADSGERPDGNRGIATEQPTRPRGNGDERPSGTPAADSCGAGRYQYLVGKHRSEIPSKPAGAAWRVTCTTCPTTMDFSERRLNILYDEESGVVEAVRCG